MLLPDGSPAPAPPPRRRYPNPTSPAYPGLGGRPVQDPGDEPLPGPAGYPPQTGPPPAAPAAPPFVWDPNMDPSVIAANAAAARDRADTIVNYGDASGLGADSGTAAEAANNPYSVVAQLKRQLQGDLSGINNSANAHGLLFSGANVQGHSNEYAAGQQRSSTAHQALLGQLNAITDKAQAAYWNAFNTHAASGGAA